METSEPSKPDSSSSKRSLTSSEILAGHEEVIIDHRGQRYRLRQTRAGKLILTK